jgi:uncharacterized membrane protein YgcG
VSRSDRKALARAVEEAERATGMQLAVYIGPVEGDPQSHVDRLLQDGGAGGQPGVLLLVVPDVRRVEIRTSPEARVRVPDDAVQRAVDVMVPLLSEGKLARGVTAALAVIVAAAGAGGPEGPELPDVLTP